MGWFSRLFRRCEHSRYDIQTDLSGRVTQIRCSECKKVFPLDHFDKQKAVGGGPPPLPGGPPPKTP